jgi:hypothetical protein
MKFFFKARRGGAIAGGVFFLLFFTLLSVVGSLYLSLGVGNPVNKVTTSLIGNRSFTNDAGKYFVSKSLETATGDERTLLNSKGVEISGAITSVLVNPVFKQELDAISNIAYNFYTNGNKSVRTVDVKPLADLALLGLESVDPQFKQLKKELEKIKPIKLQPQKSGPDLAAIKSDLRLAIFLLMLLVSVSKVGYARFAKSLKDYLRTLSAVLLGVGALLVLLSTIASSIISHQASTATDSLAREAIPIAAHPLIAPILNVGIFEVVVGALILVTSFVVGSRTKGNAQKLS